MSVKKVLRRMSNLLPDETYIRLMYRWRMKKGLNLINPRTYNEKLQWLKLHDRNPLYTRLVDKYEVRQYIAECVGEEHLIPLVGGPWESFDEIDFDALPNQFVLKCTHDSGGMLICRDKSALDMREARKRIEQSLATNYYYHGREWPYKNVRPRIIAEKYMAEASPAPAQQEQLNVQQLQAKHGLLDYKFMCFDGVVRLLFLDIGVIGTSAQHANEYFRNVYDVDFVLQPVRETRENYPCPIAKPDFLPEMVRIAQALAIGLPHVRVDLYQIDGRIYVGEMTLYHGSGLSNRFNPVEWDEKLGDWICLPS